MASYGDNMTLLFWVLVTHHMRYIRLGYRRIGEDAGKGCLGGADTKPEFIIFYSKLKIMSAWNFYALLLNVLI